MMQEVLRAATQTLSRASSRTYYLGSVACTPMFWDVSRLPPKEDCPACVHIAGRPAIGVLPAVGHAENTSLAMQQPGVHFVLEGGPIYGLTPRPGARGVTTLHA